MVREDALIDEIAVNLDVLCPLSRTSLIVDLTQTSVWILGKSPLILLRRISEIATLRRDNDDFVVVYP
jgi:hypothetical protein